MPMRPGVLILVAVCLLGGGCGRSSRQPGNDQGYGVMNHTLPRPGQGHLVPRYDTPYGRARAPVAPR